MLPLVKTKEGQATLFVPEQSSRDPFHCPVFFNPHMRLCRDLSSLWVGTLPALPSVLDVFCASGARG